MRIISFFTLLFVSLSAQASIEDLKCAGRDHENRKVKVLWDGWKDNRNTGRVDLTVDVEGIGPRTYVDLYVYIPGDEGFDYGVSAGDYMLHLVYPYEVSNPKEVRGDFYYGKKYDLDSRVFLSCKPVKIKKRN